MDGEKSSIGSGITLHLPSKEGFSIVQITNIGLYLDQNYPGMNAGTRAFLVSGKNASDINTVLSGGQVTVSRSTGAGGCTVRYTLNNAEVLEVTRDS